MLNPSKEDLSQNQVILLIDDDQAEIELFTELFLECEPAKVTLRTSTECDNIIPLLEKENPDLLLLDLNMVLKKGRDVLLEIRGSKHFANLPVIIYSTSNSASVIRDCYACGANWYIVKPSTIPMLFSMINLICNWMKLASMPAKFLVDPGYQELPES